ncbi:MAG TPA: ISAzo13 family transposase [Candidatus Tectomicrobia bacterium]
MNDHLPIAEKFKALGPILNEQGRRLWAAAEALVLGRGGVSLVAQATGLSRPTIDAGIRELRGAQAAVPSSGQGRIRRSGGGCKRRVEHDQTLLEDLEALVEPTTRGDPPSPLRWTCKSVRRLAEELWAQGHQVSPQAVGNLLHEADYSLQGTRKTREGGKPPDRNVQFEHIAARVRDFQTRHQPVISVDAKKKELVGDFKNAGREWHPQGQPPPGRVYDFIDPKLGKAISYGVYDVRATLGWVSVGVDHDTPAFAVATLRAWWLQMGSTMSPKARELLITADSGGSNSTRARLWKLERQRFPDQSGLRVCVSHLPPGTSKWNTIEHRMFCHITANWRGKPLESLEVVVSLIGDTNTSAGLRLQAALDAGQHPKGIKVSDAEMKKLQIDRAHFHGE